MVNTPSESNGTDDDDRVESGREVFGTIIDALAIIALSLGTIFACSKMSSEAPPRATSVVPYVVCTLTDGTTVQLRGAPGATYTTISTTDERYIPWNRVVGCERL